MNQRDDRKARTRAILMPIAVALIGLPATAYRQSRFLPRSHSSAWLINTVPLPARSQQASTAQPKVEFEVASVKQSKPDTPMRGQEFLMPFEAPSPKGGLFSANAPLLIYIMFAYKVLDPSQMQSISQHLPVWARDERFEIQARAPQDQPTKDQIRAMMRSLLEDRFKLAIHTETRQVPVYALILEKPGTPGPQLKPHPADQPCSDQADTPPPATRGGPPPPYCGMAVWRVNGLLHFRMVNVSMEEMAAMLGGAAGAIGGRDLRPIIDQTGLTGRFDLNIEFLKDPGGADLDTDAAGPTFTNALKNQLGMKLAKETGSAQVFVLDHIEQPSEN